MSQYILRCPDCGETDLEEINYKEYKCTSCDAEFEYEDTYVQED